VALCVLLACAAFHGVAIAAEGATQGAAEGAPEGPAARPAEEKPTESSVELPAQPGEFYLPNQPAGEIVRVSPQGIDLTYTDATTGYRTHVRAKRAVTWIKRTKTVMPDGTEKTVQQVEVYAEGDVVIIQKDLVTGLENKSYCQTLYYDFLHRKGVMLDGWFKMYEGRAGAYLYLAAKEVRELATGDANTTRLKLYDARFTNDEFGRPVLYFQAKTLEMEQKRNQVPGRLRGTSFVRYYAKNIFLKFRKIPLFYIPYSSASTLNKYFIQSFRIGNSSKYGTYVMTRWNLQDLGLLENDWSNLTLRLDEFSKRGLGVGFNFDYEKPDYRGAIEGYTIHDHGKDRVGDDNITPEVDSRGRLRATHHQALGDGWNADVALSRISDRGFLREFYRNEFDQGTEQDTALSIWRTEGHSKISGIGRGQVNDFLTSTEYLPRVRASELAWPIFGDRMYASFDTQVARVTRHFDDSFNLADQDMFRADLNTEVSAPVNVSILRVNPFLGLRGTFYDQQLNRSGSTGRFTGYFGFDAGTQFSKVYDSFLGRKHVNHVVHPYVRFYDVFANTKDPEHLIQADSVDIEDKREVWTVGVRQLFQTKHGEPGKERSFDAVIVDLNYNVVRRSDPLQFLVNKAGQMNTVFPDGLRMADSFKGDIEWNLYRSLSVFGSAEYVTSMRRLDLYDYGFHLYPSDKTSLTVRNYFVRNDGTSSFTNFMNIFPYEIDRENTFFPWGPITDFAKRNVVQVDYEWEASEKWALALYVAYDFENSESIRDSFVIRRYFHNWVLDMGFNYDHGDRNTTLSINLSPVGMARKFAKRRNAYESPEGVNTGREAMERNALP
jgi:hypothetical protein